jgi:lactoylglutathione lyase
MQLKLMVIRTGNMQKLVAFYTLLGLLFEYHKHGNSPYHYSAKIHGTVIEIYPLQKGQDVADKSLRLGFTLNNFDEIISLLGDNIVSAPTQTEWGYMAIATDPDGRKIELYKK